MSSRKMTVHIYQVIFLILQRKVLENKGTGCDVSFVISVVHLICLIIHIKTVSLLN